MRILSLLTICLVLTGCSSNWLFVQTEYLRREKLASYFVHTPDPLLENPLVGQRLIIEWDIPPVAFEGYYDLHIAFTLRFANRSELVRKLELYERQGMYIFELQEEEFCNRGAFLTYKVELIGSDCVLDAWYHQLWTPLIRVGEEEEDECPSS